MVGCPPVGLMCRGQVILVSVFLSVFHGSPEYSSASTHSHFAVGHLGVRSFFVGWVGWFLLAGSALGRAYSGGPLGVTPCLVAVLLG